MSLSAHAQTGSNPVKGQKACYETMPDARHTRSRLKLAPAGTRGELACRITWLSSCTQLPSGEDTGPPKFL